MKVKLDCICTYVCTITYVSLIKKDWVGVYADNYRSSIKTCYSIIAESTFITKSKLMG